MVVFRSAFLLLLCLIAKVYGEIELEILKELHINMSRVLSKAKEVNNTIEKNLKNTDLDQFMKELDHLNVKEKIKHLKIDFDDLLASISLTNSSLEKLEFPISEKQVQQVGTKIQNLRENLDIVNNKVVNQSDYSENLPKIYSTLDETVRTQETLYVNFINRIEDLHRKSDDVENMFVKYNMTGSNVTQLIELNMEEKARMMREIEKMTSRNLDLEQKIQKLKSEIKILKEKGVYQTNSNIATDSASGKGKKVHLVLVT